MTIYYRLIAISLLGLLLLTACSDERKKQAVRLAADMEARERGETLVDSAADTSKTLSSLAAPLEVPDSSIVAVGSAIPDTPRTKAMAELARQETIPAENIRRLPSEEPATIMPPLIRDGFTVQVESSPLKSYIDSQVELFKQRGYDAYLSAITRPDDQKTFYRLRIGRYSSLQEATAASKELNSTFNLQSWVDKTTFGPATQSGE